ncbi:MAG: hypothetical protein AAGC60_02750 [Acidobacteriota bacterium]
MRCARLRSTHFTPCAVLGLVLCTLALCVAARAAAAPEPPVLRFEAPDTLQGQVEQLSTFDLETLVPIMELVGLEQPGPPIRVILAVEGSEPTRILPGWGVAYAFGAAGTVVLIPSRVPAYPNDDLDAVLRHEIAHVLVARAAGRRPVPRWFNEGVATIAARPWSVEDRTRFLLAALAREKPPMAEIEHGFHAGRFQASRAYALSTAFVRWLLDQEGDDAAARILRRIRDGMAFDAAFREVTGRPLAEAEARFWSRIDFWQRWLPFLTGPSFLWVLVTVLAVVAAWYRRRRNEEMEERWREEEEAIALAEADVDQRWVH